MKIKTVASLAALPSLLGAAADAANNAAASTPQPQLHKNRQRKTIGLPGNRTVSANRTVHANHTVANITAANSTAANFTSISFNTTGPATPLPGTSQTCEVALENHQYENLTSVNPIEVCAEQSVSDGKTNLNRALMAYQLAGDDAREAGFEYKAGLSYGKAAILEHTLRKFDDVGLLTRRAHSLIGTINAAETSSASSPAQKPGQSNEAKAFETLAKIGDFVAMADLRKSLGVTAHARFPELSDIEKINRYNFHDKVKWKDVSTPADLGVIEKKLNSGNVLRMEFIRESDGSDAENPDNKSVPRKEDLQRFGDVFVNLIDLSPTFRHNLYKLLESKKSPAYTIRVNIDPSGKYLGNAAIGGDLQTLFPYHPDGGTIGNDVVQTTVLHEFGHSVQLGAARDADDTTVLRLIKGSSHDRQQTAFMGGVINEYNHFLKLARASENAPEDLGKTIKTNIDQDDYCEDLMLTKPEWIASEASAVLSTTSDALAAHDTRTALQAFSKIATSDTIDIEMFDAFLGPTPESRHIETYNTAELTLQQLLLKIDQADWFAEKGTAENTRTRETMGSFLNLLVEKGQVGSDAPDWRTTINGAFNYLSMDPKVEIPNYAYAENYPGRVPAARTGESTPLPGIDGNQGAGDTKDTNGTKGSHGTPTELVAVMAAMSAVIAAMGVQIVRKRNHVPPPASSATAAVAAAPAATTPIATPVGTTQAPDAERGDTLA